MYYAGIGSKETPEEVFHWIEFLTSTFHKKHQLIMRSGGAPGADTYFERGVDIVGGQKEIYLPWKSFNDNPSNLYRSHPKAEDLAEFFHPSWNNLSRGAKALHTRNIHQILGINLEQPTSFVVCWTKDGVEHGSQTTSKTGGTGQAIRIASHYGIKIYNLKRYMKFMSPVEVALMIEDEVLNKLYKT